MKNFKTIIIDDDSWLDLSNISQRVFFPLDGFLDQKNYQSVVEEMHLQDNIPWTIPITLELPPYQLNEINPGDDVNLVNKQNNLVGNVIVSDIYKINPSNDIKKIYKTEDEKHPGVKKELSRSQYRVGGKIKLIDDIAREFPEKYFTPDMSKKIFSEKKWDTIVGFQTRNPPHLAHEYLQKIGMEITDGIFIQPLIGWKKTGDFTPKSILEAYQIMMDQFYPQNRAVLGTLTTAMRYAGPREAVFHSIIRKNYGCTHFIVGRDHAGVGNYYGKYEAQQLCKSFSKLGIEIISLAGPRFCYRCNGITTEKTCNHEQHLLDVSGTFIRDLLSNGKKPPVELMRKEISDKLIELHKTRELFI